MSETPTPASTTDEQQPEREAPAAPGSPIELTPKAVTMIKLTREQEGLDASCGLRVAVRGGGCSGFEYALDFDQEPRPDDFVLQYDGLQVMIDAISARYLEGTRIDYLLGAQGSGFKFENPNATGSCGCGSSFAL